MTEGLRERKRRRTQQALYGAALELFAERGWTGTTVAAVAEAAEVSPRTFFSYFPSKEALLFHRYESAFVALETALVLRPHGASALEELERWLEGDVLPLLSDRAGEELVDRLLLEADSLVSYGLRVLDRLERALAAALRADLGRGDEDPLPDVAAAAALASLQRSLLVPGSDLGAAMRTSLRFAQAGLAACLEQGAGPSVDPGSTGAGRAAPLR